MRAVELMRLKVSVAERVIKIRGEIFGVSSSTPGSLGKTRVYSRLGFPSKLIEGPLDDSWLVSISILLIEAINN